jgi:predicted amidophosphoribosyltransferase
VVTLVKDVITTGGAAVNAARALRSLALRSLALRSLGATVTTKAVLDSVSGT